MASASRKLRHLARVLSGERKITAATRRALEVLLTEAARALAAAGYSTDVLDSRLPGWRAAVDKDIIPTIEEAFTDAFTAAGRGVVDPAPYATRHIESVHNRLVGVSDDVFDSMRLTLEEGRRVGEGIPALAARVGALLADDQRWNGRAALIARTEVVSANNAGAYDSSRATAAALGIDEADVAREWLATMDSRTRESHAEADGQIVIGMDTPFTVGGDSLEYPGDPSGDPAETSNCRCTVLFVYPGDPEYADAVGGRAFGGRTTVSEARSVPPVTQLPTRMLPGPVVAPAAIDTPVDSGPSTDMERMARALTIPELQAEARRTRGSRDAVKVAKAELRRRGIAASLIAAPTMEDDMADDETRTGVVLVALPAADDPVHTIGPEDKHCTLLYFGDITGGDNPNDLLTDDFRTLLSQVAAETTGVQEQSTEQVTGVENLGDDAAVVWMLAPGPMTALRDRLLTEDVAAVLNSVEQFPTYQPHVTVGYPTDGEGEVLTDEMLDAAKAVESIRFDRLALWWAGEQTEWPLSGGTEEEEDVETETDPALSMALALVRTAGYAVNLTAADEPRSPEDTPTTPVPETAQEIDPDGEPFYGIAAPEDVLSGDGRLFATDALTWRDLPLPLMFQDAQAPGHDGAVRVGRLDVLERDTSGTKPMIRYSGVWDTSPIAQEARRQVSAGVLRGVSVDCDAVTVEVMASDGTVLDPMVDEFPADGVVIERATAARIGGLTCCSFPAFHQAYIANGVASERTEPEPGMGEVQEQSGTDRVPDEAVAASAAPAWSLTAGAVLPALVQPAGAFTRPACLDDYATGHPMTVTEDGRVYGHLAVWGTCHIGVTGLCQEPPASASNYAHFYGGGRGPTDDGAWVSTGPLVMGTGHAGLKLGHRAAAAHYDNTGTCTADVAMGQDHIGIWFAGTLRPGTTPEQVYAMRAAGKVSGDWRNIGGALDLVAALVVNTPGFPIPNPALAATSEHGAEAMVAAGVVQTPHPVETRQEIEVVVASAVAAALDRRDRTTSAWARLNSQRASVRRRRVAAASARINERV